MKTAQEMMDSRKMFAALGVTTEGHDHWAYVLDAAGNKVEVLADDGSGDMVYQTVNSHSVTISLQDAKTGNTVVRRLTETVSDGEAVKIVAEMKKEMKARGKATRQSVAAERSLDAE